MWMAMVGVMHLTLEFHQLAVHQSLRAMLRLHSGLQRLHGRSEKVSIRHCLAIVAMSCTPGDVPEAESTLRTCRPACSLVGPRLARLVLDVAWKPLLSDVLHRCRFALGHHKAESFKSRSQLLQLLRAVKCGCSQRMASGGAMQTKSMVMACFCFFNNMT